MSRYAATFGVLALVAAACGGGGAELPLRLEDGSRPNVIVYLVDTLRADYLGCYGHERDTSPVVDAFAEECVFFESARTQVSWTKPSVGTLFTALLPTNHGAVRREHALRPDVTRLAEVMKAAGYRTGGIVTNPNVLPVYGFDRGFDDYVDLESVQRTARAEQLHELAGAWLDEHGDEPFFLYLHARDPHDPFEPPSPFRERFRPKQLPADPAQARARQLRALYRGEIAYWDHQMGVLFDDLRARGLYDDTIIVLLSDHGEEFVDHGQYGHGRTLYDEQLHVPLMIRLPGGAAARRVAETVRIVDVAPTVCELLGIDFPGPVDGTSFAAAMFGDDGYDPLLYAELNHDAHLISSYSDGRYKVIRRDAREAGDVPRTELYDLSEDPRERRDLSRELPDVTSRLLAELALIESSLNHGVYLELCNGVELGDTHTLTGSLEVTSGRFEEVDATELEEGDTMRLVDDGRRVEFEVRLVNVPNPIGQFPPVLRDVDRVRVTLSDPDAELVLDARLDGEALDARRVALARGPYTGESPVRVAARAPQLQHVFQGHASANPVLSAAAYCRLFAIQRTDPNEVDISAELDERLNALGYTE